jgi:hypothetical protein
MEKDTEKEKARIVILVAGLTAIVSVFCYGCRQLALLEDRIARETRYELLNQELIELTDDCLDDLLAE